jgi:ribose 5-phosphate isomerase RpiB
VVLVTTSNKLAKEVAALIKGNRMREHALDLFQFHARRGDQSVAYAEAELAFNEDVSGEQQVVVLGDGTGE